MTKNKESAFLMIKLMGINQSSFPDREISTGLSTLISMILIF